MQTFFRFALLLGAALGCGAAALLPPRAAFAQGSLTPPGAPAPTMKTLDQIEPRTLISSLPYTISNPGSYYLAGSLTPAASGNVGVTISASHVTLDLRGFELIGNGGTTSTHGVILGSGVSNVTIRNGTVRNWAGSGISASNADGGICAENLRVTGNGFVGMFLPADSVAVGCMARANTLGGISVGTNSQVLDCEANDNNGNFAIGISADDSSLVRGCTANGNTGAGMDLGARTVVVNCTATFNSSYGIDASGETTTIIGCTAAKNSVSGILTGVGSTVTACTASTNGACGIIASTGTTVSGCTVRSNTTDGIQASGACLITGCTAISNGSGGSPAGSNGSGIAVIGIGDNRIEGNNLIANGRALTVSVAGNFIARNTASGSVNSAGNYNIIAGNAVGPIVSSPSSAAINGNTATGSTVGSTDPWANFSF